MVKLLVLTFCTLATAVLLACGSGDETSQPNTPAARSTPTWAAPGTQASLDPARGRPGTEVVVRGSGWQPGAMITIAGAISGVVIGSPYAITTAATDGSFVARFRIDRAPDGGTLNPGIVNIVVKSDPPAEWAWTLSFTVLPPAPGGPGGPGG